jgi:hypothetical protein
MKDLNAEQRDTIIDQYCDWFVKTANRTTLEWMARDQVHEELHSMPNELIIELIERDNPELLGAGVG